MPQVHHISHIRKSSPEPEPCSTKKAQERGHKCGHESTSMSVGCGNSKEFTEAALLLQCRCYTSCTEGMRSSSNGRWGLRGKGMRVHGLSGGRSAQGQRLGCKTAMDSGHCYIMLPNCTEYVVWGRKRGAGFGGVSGVGQQRGIAVQEGHVNHVTCREVRVECRCSTAHRQQGIKWQSQKLSGKLGSAPPGVAGTAVSMWLRRVGVYRAGPVSCVQAVVFGSLHSAGGRMDAGTTIVHQLLGHPSERCIALQAGREAYRLGPW